ncbi:MAG: transglutaminase family protein [Chlamydiales bacterium]
MIFLFIATAALFNSLDPSSVAQSIAYHQLYPEHAPSFKRVMDLLGTACKEEIAAVGSALGKSSDQLLESEIILIEKLAARLPNRKLNGYYAHSEKEIFPLHSAEIDLGMALLLSQLDGQSDCYLQARRYSAMLDLMALQILAALPHEATAIEKIEETNRFIFDKMHFRFPPHSLYADQIDRYTFLPSVMDNHLGVCLGVTALYLAIAQRIGLSLEIITPPGHIYIRHHQNGQIINIETTARGTHPISEVYLGINNRSLRKRDLKEVIGMTYINQGSAYLNANQFAQALNAYKKAFLYLPEDILMKELLGYSYILNGQKEEGEKLLNQIKGQIPDEAVVKHGMVEDYLAGNVGIDGIQVVFSNVDETRNSIIKKQKALQAIMQKYPHFKEGMQQLAVTWIQLHRTKEAIKALHCCMEMDPDNPITAYYLAMLYGERQDFKACWYYLIQAESITAKHNFLPKALKDLRRMLTAYCPQ